MKFQEYRYADISTRYITQADCELLATCPHHIAEVGDAGQTWDMSGTILHVPVSDPWEVAEEEYLEHGMSHEFLDIMRELHTQKFDYVRFDGDGADIEGDSTPIPGPV